MQASQEDPKTESPAEPATKPKEKTDNDSFWELMGKCVTGFALAGTITGASTSIALETIVNDKPLKEVSGEKAVRAAFDHAQGLAFTGIFLVALIGVYGGKKTKEQKPEEEKPQPPAP